MIFYAALLASFVFKTNYPLQLIKSRDRISKLFTPWISIPSIPPFGILAIGTTAFFKPCLKASLRRS